MANCDIAILGAGPYGLAAASHLKAIKGLEVRVFGEPMSFWDRNMPVGMFLRSNWTATQIAAPDDKFTLEAFQTARGIRLSQPVPLDPSCNTGAGINKTPCRISISETIARVERDPKGFRITSRGRRGFLSRRVVVAAGIGSFAWRPPEFDDVPSCLASHTSEHRDLGKFAGKESARGRRRAKRAGVRCTTA